MYELWLIPGPESGQRFRERCIGVLTDKENAEAAADGICGHYLDAGERLSIGVRQVGADPGDFVYKIGWQDIENHRRVME